MDVELIVHPLRNPVKGTVVKCSNTGVLLFYDRGDVTTWIAALRKAGLLDEAKLS